MSDKRFDLVCEGNLEWLLQSGLFISIKDKNTNKKITLQQCYDLLNNFAKENQDNKVMIEFLNTENTQIMNELKTRTQIQHQLEQDNKQLKEENYKLKQGIIDYSQYLTDKSTELEKELLIYRKIANCSNCKYQNYNWFEDGDEFEICEKGNNEQQMEYHICKEWEELE